jgi:hypothetical protein
LKRVKRFLKTATVSKFQIADSPIEEGVFLLKSRLFGQLAKKISRRGNIALAVKNLRKAVLYTIALGG